MSSWGAADRWPVRSAMRTWAWAVGRLLGPEHSPVWTRLGTLKGSACCGAVCVAANSRQAQRGREKTRAPAARGADCMAEAVEGGRLARRLLSAGPSRGRVWGVSPGRGHELCQ